MGYLQQVLWLKANGTKALGSFMTLIFSSLGMLEQMDTS